MPGAVAAFGREGAVIGAEQGPDGNIYAISDYGGLSSIAYDARRDVFYVISDDISRLPVFDDLAQKNLIVGIAFMAVGFTFATRWE